MSLLKELNESHETLKAIAISSFLIPFWYVAIFLFNNEFYNSSDNIIIFSMCFVITFCSSVGFTFFIGELKFENQTYKTFFNQMIISVAMLIGWLSTLIFVIYSLGFLFNIYIYFYWFIVIYFLPLFILYLLLKIFGIDKNEKK